MTSPKEKLGIGLSNSNDVRIYFRHTLRALFFIEDCNRLLPDGAANSARCMELAHVTFVD